MRMKVFSFFLALCFLSSSFSYAVAGFESVADSDFPPMPGTSFYDPQVDAVPCSQHLPLLAQMTGEYSAEDKLILRFDTNEAGNLLMNFFLGDQIVNWPVLGADVKILDGQWRDASKEGFAPGWKKELFKRSELRSFVVGSDGVVVQRRSVLTDGKVIFSETVLVFMTRELAVSQRSWDNTSPMASTPPTQLRLKRVKSTPDGSGQGFTGLSSTPSMPLGWLPKGD